MLDYYEIYEFVALYVTNCILRMTEEISPNKVVLRAVYSPLLIDDRTARMLSTSVNCTESNVPINIIINPIMVPIIPSVRTASETNHSTSLSNRFLKNDL